MKRDFLLLLLSGTLAVLDGGGPTSVAAGAQEPAKAEQKADEKEDDQQQDKRKQQQQDDAKKQKEAQPRRILSRVPKHQARPNPIAQRRPHALLTQQEMFVPEAARNRKAAAKAQPQPNAQPDQQAEANRQQPNPPFWSPRQLSLSPAATYRLESMGQHVHLSPAMRLHIGRSQQSAAGRPAIQIPSPSMVPGQGARQYYPAVSRQPAQKPFADLERPPSGLESYWPLLLEGREDPNTGLIIWTLP